MKIEFTEPEVTFLKEIINSATLSGNVKALATALQLATSILIKLEEATRTPPTEKV